MALKVRRKRRQAPGKFKLHQTPWFDPYPMIPGTQPEKRVFAMLKDMGIYFIFHGDAPKDSKDYTFQIFEADVDFLLPEYRLVIDPFSPFHHSLPGSLERDRFKVTAFSAAGYAYYHPWAVGPGKWSWDQYHDSRKKIVARDRKGRVVSTIKLYGGVNAARNNYRGFSRALSGPHVMTTYEMLRSIPELVQGPHYKLTDPRDIKAKQFPGYRIGEHLGKGAFSVAAANKARANKTPALGIRYGQRRTIRRS